METKFTKGPWVYTRSNSPLTGLKGEIEVYSADESILEWIALCHNEADAKLIAAAHDLLSALIEVRQNLRDYGYPWLVGINDKEITKVIKKAIE